MFEFTSVTPCRLEACDLMNALGPAEIQERLIDRQWLDLRGQFQHQADRQRRGRIAAPLRSAQHHLMVFRGLQIERGIAHARGDQEFQFGQRVEQRAGKRRSLAHRADDLEIFQRAGSGLRRRKRLVEYRDIDAV